MSDLLHIVGVGCLLGGAIRLAFAVVPPVEPISEWMAAASIVALGVSALAVGGLKR